MGSNIVHQYFKKEDKLGKILVKLDPVHLKGIELFVDKKGNVSSRQLEFDGEILEDLKVDGFESSSPLEFNLYHSGLAGKASR